MWFAFDLSTWKFRLTPEVGDDGETDVHCCIAVNFSAKSWGHHEALTGFNRGTPYNQWKQRVVEQPKPNVFKPWSNRCILKYLFNISRSWMIPMAAPSMLEVTGYDDPLIYGMLLWRNVAGGRTLGSGKLQPTKKAFWLQHLPDFVALLHIYFLC